MHFAIIGCGAMGSLYGGRLALAGHQVTMIDVWQAHIDAVNRDGLVMELDGQTHVARCRATVADGATEPADVAVLFTKTYHSQSALQGAKRVLGPDTLVLTLQNGLGNIEAIEPFVPRGRIVAGTSTFPSDLLGPGRISSHGAGKSLVMTANGQRTPALENLAAALDAAGLNCHIDGNVMATIWEKVAFNSALNTLCAVSRAPVGIVSDSREGQELARAIVDEVLDVAQARGVGVDRERVHATVSMALDEHRAHKPSMLQDLLAGRRTEIDSLNGAVAREAEKAGLAAPVTQTMWRLVKMIEQGH